MSKSLRGAATAVSALAFAACGGSEDATAPPATTEQETGELTTTEPEPEPITASEERWLQQIESYKRRFERDYGRGGAITHATMRRSAELYRACGRALRGAGNPGRFEPVQAIVERACERLQKAADLLEQAIAASDPGGSVLVGSPEEKRFKRAVDGTFEAAGNAQYDLLRALERAEAIERSLAS